MLGEGAEQVVLHGGERHVAPVRLVQRAGVEVEAAFAHLDLAAQRRGRGVAAADFARRSTALNRASSSRGL